MLLNSQVNLGCFGRWLLIVWEGVCLLVWEGACLLVWEGECLLVWEGVCLLVWEGDCYLLGFRPPKPYGGDVIEGTPCLATSARDVADTARSAYSWNPPNLNYTANLLSSLGNHVKHTRNL
jgi:hypothetical protein